jgi:hypothetical protein
LEHLKEIERLKDLVVNVRNLKIDLKCTGWVGVVLSGLAQDRDNLNTVIKLRVA